MRSAEAAELRAAVAVGFEMRVVALVRVVVVALCILPCVSAAILAARRTRPAEKICRWNGDADAVPVDQERKSSSLVVVRVGERRIALVADTDAQAIVAFDLRKKDVLSVTRVGGDPTHLLLGQDSRHKTRLYVTQRESNAVAVLDVSPRGIACGDEPVLHPVAELKTADEPVAMALAPNGETLLVAAGWGHTLEGFSTRSHAKVFAVDVPREPRAVVVDREGTRAFISHAARVGLTVVDLGGTHEARTIALRGAFGAASVESRDGSMMGAPNRFRFAFGSDFGFEPPRGVDPSKPPASKRRALEPTQGFALAAVTEYGRSERILLPEVLVDPGEVPRIVAARPTGYGGGGGVDGVVGPASAHVAVISTSTETPVAASMTLEVADVSCLLPRAAAIDPNRQSLFVACLGTDEIDEYEATAESPTNKLRGRWKVPEGPTGIVVDDDKIMVWSSFARVLTVIERSGDVTHASVIHERPGTPFEIGRALFHSSNDPRISSDGRACASCHPDGRDDGLTWTSPDGPRQTPMLAGRLEASAPFGWTGTSSTVRLHLQQTLSRLGGQGLADRETYALLTYLARMKTPHRTAKDAASKVARGSAIFRSYEAGCSSCHLDGERATGDGETHDIGSKVRGDLFAEFATPSLQFVGGTGPYFHDGRYATLKELLRATDGVMGNTGHLGSDDLDALTAYVESL